MRLTNEKRDAYIKQIVETLFESKKKEIEKEKIECANLLINDAFDHELLNSLPEGTVPKSNHLHFAGDGNFHFNHSFDKEVRYPYKNHAFGSIRIVNSYISKPVETKVYDFIRKHEKLKDEIKASTNEIKAILYSVNTSNQLIEIWPEINNLISFDDPVKVENTQLAPIVSKYNKLLELKK